MAHLLSLFFSYYRFLSQNATNLHNDASESFCFTVVHRSIDQSQKLHCRVRIVNYIIIMDTLPVDELDISNGMFVYGNSVMQRCKLQYKKTKYIVTLSVHES